MKSQKKFSEQKQAYVGMEPSKTNQTRWEWDYNTFTPSLHLVPFYQPCLVFIICVNTRVVEGSGVDVVLHGCAVHDYVHGEDKIWSVLYAEAVECMSSAWSVWHVGVSVMLSTSCC